MVPVIDRVPAPATLGALVVAGAATLRLGSLLPLVLAGAGSFVVAGHRRDRGRDRARRRERTVVAEFVVELDVAVRSGAALAGAARRGIARRDDAPGFDRASAELAGGAALPAALRRAATGAGGDLGLVWSTLAVCGERGGSAAAALSRLTDVLMRSERAEAERRAAGAQARASALVVVGLPIGFAVVAAAVDPSVRGLYLTPVGTACAGVALTLDLIGWRWMQREVRR